MRTVILPVACLNRQRHTVIYDEKDVMFRFGSRKLHVEAIKWDANIHIYQWLMVRKKYATHNKCTLNALEIKF